MLTKYRQNLKENLEHVGFSEKAIDRAEIVSHAALKHLGIDASKSKTNVFISNSGKLTDANQPTEEYASYVYSVGSVWIHVESMLMEIRNFSNSKVFDLDRLCCPELFYQRRKFWRTGFDEDHNLVYNDFSELNLEFQTQRETIGGFAGEFHAFGKTNIEILIEFVSCFNIKK